MKIVSSSPQVPYRFFHISFLRSFQSACPLLYPYTVVYVVRVREPEETGTGIRSEKVRASVCNG